MSTDRQLRQQFEQCVDQHADSMYRVAFRLTGNRDIATELVQETYCQAWGSIQKLRDLEKIRSWMFAILRNQYSKHIRKTKRIQQLEAPESLSAPDESGADTTEIQIGIQQLDEKYKLPLLLVSMEGLSVEEAAGVLDLPKGTVLTRLHRGRNSLKEIIERMRAIEK